MSTQVGGRRPCVTPLCSAPACCQAVLAHLCPPACTRTRSHARRWSPPPPRPLRSLTRVGVMVLVCHESNDIFLEAAKVRGTQGRMGGGGGGGGSAGMLALTQQRCAGGRRVGTPPWRQQKVGSGRMGAQARWVTGDPMRAGQARMWSRSRRAQIKPARLQMHALLPPPSPPLRWHGTPSMRWPPPPSLWVSEEAVEEEGGREGGGVRGCRPVAPAGTRRVKHAPSLAARASSPSLALVSRRLPRHSSSRRASACAPPPPRPPAPPPPPPPLPSLHAVLVHHPRLHVPNVRHPLNAVRVAGGCRGSAAAAGRFAAGAQQGGSALVRVCCPNHRMAPRLLGIPRGSSLLNHARVRFCRCPTPCRRVPGSWAWRSPSSPTTPSSTPSSSSSTAYTSTGEAGAWVGAQQLGACGLLQATSERLRACKQLLPLGNCHRLHVPCCSPQVLPHPAHRCQAAHHRRRRCVAGQQTGRPRWRPGLLQQAPARRAAPVHGRNHRHHDAQPCLRRPCVCASRATPPPYTSYCAHPPHLDHLHSPTPAPAPIQTTSARPTTGRPPPRSSKPRCSTAAACRSAACPPPREAPHGRDVCMSCTKRARPLGRLPANQRTADGRDRASVSWRGPLAFCPVLRRSLAQKMKIKPSAALTAQGRADSCPRHVETVFAKRGGALEEVAGPRHGAPKPGALPRGAGHLRTSGWLYENSREAQKGAAGPDQPLKVACRLARSTSECLVDRMHRTPPRDSNLPLIVPEHVKRRRGSDQTPAAEGRDRPSSPGPPNWLPSPFIALDHRPGR